MTSGEEQPPASKTARRLAVFDLDGTLTRHDTFLPFVGGLLLREPGRWWRIPLLLWPAVGYLTGRVDRGALKGAVLRLLFRGLPRKRIADWAERHARRVIAAGMHEEGLRAWRAHQAAGDELILLSASPDLYVPRIGAALGAAQVLCTPVLWKDGRLDGHLAGPNHRGAVKTQVLAALRAQRPDMAVIAYGNSPADLDHMLGCEQAVYVNGGEALRRAMPQKNLRWVRWR
ncbi:MAG: HAD-IB family phosphatase [Steroidobacteraceae bacterium]